VKFQSSNLEHSESSLGLTRSVNFFVQVACPRLSIDWGKYFDKPLLTPYEFYTLIDKVQFNVERYPMDYYSDNGGEWTNYFHKKKEAGSKKNQIKLEFEATPKSSLLTSTT
jgi:hypothetical protein